MSFAGSLIGVRRLGRLLHPDPASAVWEVVDKRWFDQIAPSRARTINLYLGQERADLRVEIRKELRCGFWAVFKIVLYIARGR
jgi:hypothetical protein